MSLTVNLITKTVGQDKLDKEMIHIWAGQSGAAYFITVLRMAHNLKLMNCLFQNFPFHNFRLRLTTGNLNLEKQK